MAEGIRLDVDIYERPAPLIHLVGHLVGQVGGAGGADHDQQRGLLGGFERTVKMVMVFVVALIEQQDMWPGAGTAERAAQMFPVAVG